MITHAAAYTWFSLQQWRVMTVSVLETLRDHHSDSYGWALACCRWESAIAEDVLQEAYLRTLDGRARFSGRASAKTWFFAVIKRVAAELYRTRKRRSTLELQLVSSEQLQQSNTGAAIEQDSGYELAQQSESSQQLRGALMQLPLRQREVIHLVFYAECTIEEAASTLGISLGSARTHYHRGKSRLTELMVHTHDAR
jgi:RNA polymerase sigma factor (sigma-70 family)